MNFQKQQNSSNKNLLSPDLFCTVQLHPKPSFDLRCSPDEMAFSKSAQGFCYPSSPNNNTFHGERVSFHSPMQQHVVVPTLVGQIVS